MHCVLQKKKGIILIQNNPFRLNSYRFETILIIKFTLKAVKFARTLLKEPHYIKEKSFSFPDK